MIQGIKYKKIEKSGVAEWVQWVTPQVSCDIWGKPTTTSLSSEYLSLFVSLPLLLYPVNPYLTRGLTDVAQGKAIKLATAKQTAFMKVKQVTFCDLLRLPSLPASALPNADVFIPPAVMLLTGIICLPDIA